MWCAQTVTMLYFILIITTLSLFFIYKLIKPTKYWEEKDVPHVKSWPIVGSLKDFVFKKKHFMDVILEMYNQHPNERCVGYMQFTKPFLMIRDIELIKKITIKDFDHFQDHLAFDNITSDPLLSKSLLSLTGENWKRMRATLSPVFTSSKMRIMYNLMTECAENFTKHFDGKENVEIEMKEMLSRFANDVIATTAFGISIDSMKEPNNEFYKMGRDFTTFGLFKGLKMFLMQIAPSLANLFQIRLFTEEISLFFRSLVRDSIKKRQEDGIVRPDLIHLLMEARKGHLKHDESVKVNEENFASVEESKTIENTTRMNLTDDEMVAQALIFFVAGFDTVSTVSCFMAHELAVHPEVQKKLQSEVDEVDEKCDGKISYEALLSMKYLDQVVCETLRLWPPAFQTDRLCIKDYVIEPKYPKEKVVFVPKRTSVMIPIVGLHRDKKYFCNPGKFDPERFNDENKSKIEPGTYLPFGSGPRNCIGSRFALLEIKILFFHVLSKFNIMPVDGTCIPLKVSPKTLSLAPENGFQLCLKSRIVKKK